MQTRESQPTDEREIMWHCAHQASTDEEWEELPSLARLLPCSCRLQQSRTGNQHVRRNSSGPVCCPTVWPPEAAIPEFISRLLIASLISRPFPRQSEPLQPVRSMFVAPDFKGSQVRQTTERLMTEQPPLCSPLFLVACHLWAQTRQCVRVCVSLSHRAHCRETSWSAVWRTACSVKRLQTEWGSHCNTAGRHKFHQLISELAKLAVGLLASCLWPGESREGLWVESWNWPRGQSTIFALAYNISYFTD